MCRNIKKLRRKNEKPSETELRDAALQYVRKISGYRVPSRANEIAFEQAIEEITVAGRKLFKNLKS
jgi:hypothetical protein